jgi:iron complex outermembrane receptor protein
MMRASVEQFRRRLRQYLFRARHRDRPHQRLQARRTAVPYWFQDHPIEHLQDIQILKGAGASPMALPRRAGSSIWSASSRRGRSGAVRLSYRSSSILREHLDIGGPLDAEGRYAFRLNAVNEEGRLYNGAYNKDQFVSLALTGRITDKLDWQLDGFYQRTRQDDQVNTISILTTTTTINGVSYKPSSLHAHQQRFSARCARRPSSTTSPA